MEERDRETYLYVVGFVFALIYLYVFSLFIFLDNYAIGLTWMCYLGIPLIALGIFLKKPNLVLSQVFILLIPDLFWSLDFFYRLLTNTSLFGFKNFFFDTTLFSRKLLALQHVLVPFLSLFCVYLIKPKKLEKALFIAIIEIFFLLGLGLFIPSLNETNCLPNSDSCFSFPNPFPLPYPVIWVIVMVLFALISYFFISYFFRYYFF
jgi:hypothetical protein